MASQLLKDSDALFQANEFAEAAQGFSYLVRVSEEYAKNPLVRSNLGMCLH